jgi:Immunity protein 50
LGVGGILMWPKNTLHKQKLIAIYGYLPFFEDVEISKIFFDRDHGSIYVTFLTNKIPDKKIQKWGNYNTMSISIGFSNIKQVNIKKFQMYGSSKFSVFDSGSNFGFKVNGSVEMDLICEFVEIERFSGFISELQ